MLTSLGLLLSGTFNDDVGEVGHTNSLEHFLSVSSNGNSVDVDLGLFRDVIQSSFSFLRDLLIHQ